MATSRHRIDPAYDRSNGAETRHALRLKLDHPIGAGHGFGASGTDVLIKVDRITDLRAAYPNYFLDVRQLLAVARAEISGRDLQPEAEAETAAEPVRDPEFCVAPRLSTQATKAQVNRPDRAMSFIRMDARSP